MSAIANDAAEERIEQRLIDELRRLTERQAMLLESGLALASELSLPAVLQRIVDLAVQITGATYGALGVLGEDGKITEFITSGVTEEERRRIGQLPRGHGILGVLIREPKSLRLRDIAEDPRSVGFPPGHPPMRSFLGAPVKARGQVYGNIYLTEKRGAEEFSAEDEGSLVVLAAQAGNAIENARLYEETLERERWLMAVREIGSAILSGAQSDEVLNIVARSALELGRADLASVAVPDADTGDLVVQVAIGLNAETMRGRRFPIGESISGDVIRSGDPMVLDDASADPRVHQPIVAAASLGPAMFFPLSARGHAFGTLAVANLRGRRRFDERDVRVVETFADQASVALEYGRVQQELQRLAVLEDRERIAKELHDGAIQALFAVGLELQATAAFAHDDRTRERVERSVEELDRVIRDLRNYIFGLRPGILAGRHMDEALRVLAEEFQEQTGVVTIADVDRRAAERLADRSGQVVQLAREALSNVRKHAQAETCRLSLRLTDTAAVLEVDDDGRGFEPDLAASKGFGLGNIRERAEQMGGDAEIASAPGAGTTVRVRVPLEG